MVELSQDNSTQCAVHDKTPGSEQKKINIVVRPLYTVAKVINDITTQYQYKTFDLVLQPADKGDLVFLNDCQSTLIYKVPGFQPLLKNTLILLPHGEWDGDIKKRYDLSLAPLKSANDDKNINGSKTNTTTKKKKSVNNKTNQDSSATNNSKSQTFFDSQNQSKNQLLAQGMTSSRENEARDKVNASAVNMTATITNQNPHITVRNSLNLSPISDPDQMSDDDLALGASASPTEMEPANGQDPLVLEHTSPTRSARHHHQIDKIASGSSSLDEKHPLSELPPVISTNGTSGYVGLVNQAMTCYLNSLLQALYMTPEFRNALYRWEFDNDNEGKNIPYQLQKLFLNLQTSKKCAVETTDLTRSFGWDSTEAWQQHDIQELCRVMFDALEHKFKNTEQANLISTLYEGQMIDYVKCLECNTEKTRSDTFLDIPLPVRPFGSSVAYSSIEEALCAFVQYETLEGNNQYYCEKCNKKCDAHKGLKFKNFPYILTLHLKRFDFDYQTMHRIKLNDKVTFPQILNLNAFIPTNGSHSSGNTATTVNEHLLNGVAGATDDYSTTDSGSAMEEDNCSNGIAIATSSSQNENDINDDDEGIDMSASTEHRHSNSAIIAEQPLNDESGPYMYELFAIMIHSGSASGGHYYAYIKEFENNEWFCFNDQTVSPITQEDIQRSFGGGSSRSYYSSAYASSTNAYMLMYRQVDSKRNENPTKFHDFPLHINNLLPKLYKEEETRINRSNRHNISDLALPELIKPRVYFYNPQLKKIKVTRVYVSQSFNLSSVLESAYDMLDVQKFAPPSHCRLVSYDQITEEILESYNNDPLLSELSLSSSDFLLEFRSDGQEFEEYKPGGNTWYVYTVDFVTMAVDGPFLVHSPANEAGDVLRHSIATRLFSKHTVAEKDIIVAKLHKSNAFVTYAPAANEDIQRNFQTMVKTIFNSLTYFYLNVPNTEPNNLEKLSIPAYELSTPLQAMTVEVGTDMVDAALMNGGSASYCTNIEDSTSNLPCINANYCMRHATIRAGQDSNSEDSSLSDGDRTLVEPSHNRGGGDSQISSSSSRSPQLSSPEDEFNSQNYDRIHNVFKCNSSAKGDTNSEVNVDRIPPYFYAIKLEATEAIGHPNRITDNPALNDNAYKIISSYKLIVNGSMKMDVFKRQIENLIRVPRNYFSIRRKHDSSDSPITSVIFLTEGETLLIELGKEMTIDEYKAKISFMRASDLNNESGKLPIVCEWIFNATMTVADAKKELVAKLHRVDSKYHTLTVKNCRIWSKGGRNPVRILAENETLSSEVRSSIVTEFLVQECENGVIAQPCEDSLTIFVRRWYAEKLYLDKFQEITLEKNCEIRNALAQVTDLTEDHIAYAKVNGSFPYTHISLLSINESMNWFSIPATIDNYPLTHTVNGNMYFYKDVRPTPLELSTQEHGDFMAKEKTRLDRLGCIFVSLASPRRERALKIYLDSPQTNPKDTSKEISGGTRDIVSDA